MADDTFWREGLQYSQRSVELSSEFGWREAANRAMGVTMHTDLVPSGCYLLDKMRVLFGDFAQHKEGRYNLVLGQ